MYNDGGPPTSETQSTGFNSGQNEAQTSCPQHQEQVQETSSRVSCENCTVNPEDPRIKGNSWHRYNDESQRATSGCNATESQAASNFVQLPQSPHTWPVNQPSGSGYPNPPRTYGSPILERQQRPTILVIVVNKPGNRNGVYPQRGYHNGIYNPTANYPIGGYQEGGYNSYSDATGGSPPNGDNGQNQNSSSGANVTTNEPENREGSDSGQDRKQSCDCCTCTRDDQFDNGDVPFTTLSGTNTADCTCEMGELEKTLASLIPNENCYCYLANMANKKKKRKRKPRSVFDRFASPPFVIEPKPNICMHCCCNRSCCSSCAPCNKCCNSCYPWY
ncbi:hypothetical protein ACLKA6_000335 [Drosophila palustris]